MHAHKREWGLLWNLLIKLCIYRNPLGTLTTLPQGLVISRTFGAIDIRAFFLPNLVYTDPFSTTAVIERVGLDNDDEEEERLSALAVAAGVDARSAFVNVSGHQFAAARLHQIEWLSIL